MSTTVKAVLLDEPQLHVQLPRVHADYYRDLTHVAVGRMDFEICWDSECNAGYADIWLVDCSVENTKLIKAPGKGLRIRLEGAELDILKAKQSSGTASVCADTMRAVLETLIQCGYIGAGTIVDVETG